jgi:hypothetical protein
MGNLEEYFNTLFLAAGIGTQIYASPFQMACRKLALFPSSSYIGIATNYELYVQDSNSSRG